MVGLASFTPAYRDNKDAHAGWTYSVGWIAFAFSLICAGYFILIAVHRMKNSNSIIKSERGSSQQNTYTPLAQFEETTDSSSEGDEEL